MGSDGSSTTTTIDYEYNAGLLEIFQEQEGWAAELYNMFKYGTTYDPTATVTGAYVNGQWVNEEDLPATSEQNYDIQTIQTLGGQSVTGAYVDGKWVNEADLPTASDSYDIQTITMGELNGYDETEQTSEMEYLQQVVEANADLLGLQTNVSAQELQLAGQTAKSSMEVLPYTTEQAIAESVYGTESAEAATSLIPYQTEASKQEALLSTGQSEASLELLPQVTELKSEYLTGLSSGPDYETAMNEAQAGVQHGYKLANEASRMDIASYGLDPSSGAYTSSNREVALSEAADVAGARTQAKEEEEEDWFNRVTTGLTLSY